MKPRSSYILHFPNCRAVISWLFFHYLIGKKLHFLICFTHDMTFFPSKCQYIFCQITYFFRTFLFQICEHRDKHVDAVKLRAQEDKWEPINCFNKAGTERFLEEMTNAGLPSVCILKNFFVKLCSLFT